LRAAHVDGQLLALEIAGSLAKITRSASVKPVPMMRSGTPSWYSFWKMVGPPISTSVSPVAKAA
jgi:hypothetical protein